MSQLTILQINVDKGGPQHEIALSTAYDEQTDVVLIQEPYISRDFSRRITKRHPSFNGKLLAHTPKRLEYLAYPPDTPQIHPRYTPTPKPSNKLLTYTPERHKYLPYTPGTPQIHPIHPIRIIVFFVSMRAPDQTSYKRRLAFRRNFREQPGISHCPVGRLITRSFHFGYAREWYSIDD